MFIDNLDSIDELVDENLKQIEQWTWQRKAEEFREFFRACITDKKKNR